MVRMQRLRLRMIRKWLTQRQLRPLATAVEIIGQDGLSELGWAVLQYDMQRATSWEWIAVQGGRPNFRTSCVMDQPTGRLDAHGDPVTVNIPHRLMQCSGEFRLCRGQDAAMAGWRDGDRLLTGPRSPGLILEFARLADNEARRLGGVPLPDIR
ncbi:hypothetical protein G7Z17_g1651 [Cylindrodendrum hubeiense]|uniref:Uncharacterized protein n=1 Tax=Cylindrodendrum hubeiense TaxID=595255 RepID=A0A9P5HMH1_9HYPO|nr:hypothetical protein G7Z17_g1651 [Cylindrodendrum hubeiense]